MKFDILLYLCIVIIYIEVENRPMNRIKEILKEQGRSQIWLAEQIGKSYNVVTNYCNNHSQPSIPVLNSISEILDVDVRELLVSNKKLTK